MAAQIADGGLSDRPHGSFFLLGTDVLDQPRFLGRDGFRDRRSTSSPS